MASIAIRRKLMWWVKIVVSSIAVSIENVYRRDVRPV